MIPIMAPELTIALSASKRFALALSTATESSNSQPGQGILRFSQRLSVDSTFAVMLRGLPRPGG
jgi:hypothetical protein